MPTKQKDDANLGGDYARDTHRGGFGDNYARDSEKARAAQSGDKQRKPQQRPIGKASE